MPISVAPKPTTISTSNGNPAWATTALVKPPEGNHCSYKRYCLAVQDNPEPLPDAHHVSAGCQPIQLVIGL